MNNLFFVRFVHFCFRFWFALVLQVVGGDEATSSFYFGVEEPVVVERTKNAHDITFLQFKLFVACVKIWACQRWVVVVTCHIHFSHVVRLLSMTPRKSYSELN